MQLQLLPGVVLSCGFSLRRLLLQQLHGRPQLDVAASIADGNSTSSQSRWAIIPFQLKPYYASGLVPAVLSAGVPATLRWMDRARWRTIFAVALQIRLTDSDRTRRSAATDTRSRRGTKDAACRGSPARHGAVRPLSPGLSPVVSPELC